MDKCIIVTCWSNAAAYDSKKPVFERQLYVDSNVVFPFSQIEASLRVLFGDQCVVGFSSQMIK